MATETKLLQHAREMRRVPTEWEKRLWRHLSNSRLGYKYKFRRQAVIEPFICDFFCPAKGLIVEVDGDTHDPDEDRRRDRLLATRAFATLRFTNVEVRDNIDGVLTVILETLRQRPDRWIGAPHPNPSPEGEGLDQS